MSSSPSSSSSAAAAVVVLVLVVVVVVVVVVGVGAVVAVGSVGRMSKTRKKGVHPKVSPTSPAQPQQKLKNDTGRNKRTRYDSIEPHIEMTYTNIHMRRRKKNSQNYPPADQKLITK